MYKCLYCTKDDKEVTFSSQEHIFPAGIGGMFQFPVGTVCDKCNTEVFSPLELDFIRNSIISLPRQFYGPGKRGSLNPSEATSSFVHLMAFDDASGEKALGVIRIGVPFQIPQFRILGPETVSIFLDPRHGDIDDQISSFLHVMRAFNKDCKFVYLTDELLNEDELYFGFWDKKYYLCAKDRESISKVLEYLEKLRIGELYETTDRILKKEIVESRQKLAFNIKAFERISAKIVFNGLCYLTSREFCHQSGYDEIREFIRYGGEGNHVILLNENQPSLDPLPGVSFPKHSHRLFIFTAKSEGQIALLNFYDSFKLAIRLSKQMIPGNSFTGIICDWTNRQDYILSDYLATLSNCAESF
ncbi:hypothetical protein EHQ46_15815 [Leptospira yanagawae]|uniref:HNH endonuclease 5 domain-containing protein n=1 Tax=Leptospira yanagawae TaxID=293069 RepID=A0ABY2LXZ8_9LEPT|nr:HNH endonuclease [Leptospira yanagawae]TGL17922.1 hypothetical protein EHQ46_15815 [Leptospira yanagawae]